MRSITDSLYASETSIIDVESNNENKIVNANVKCIKIMRNYVIKSGLISLMNSQKQKK